MKIKLPEELRDMTLETRLITYDWEKHFGSFQEATRKGSFKPLCWAKKPVLLPVSTFHQISPNSFYLSF